MIHTGAEVAPHSSYDDKEVKTLLIGVHSPSHVRSIISTGPSRAEKQLGGSPYEQWKSANMM
jgi:hypothetical protein